MGCQSSLALPGLSRVACGPGFAVGGDQLAVLGIAEFDGDDISAQRLAVRHGRDPSPVLAGIGRMVKSAGGAAHPDVGIICRQRAEDDVTRHRNRLPGLAGIERALKSAVGGERPAGQIVARAQPRGVFGRSAWRGYTRERVRLPISQRSPRSLRRLQPELLFGFRSLRDSSFAFALRSAPPSSGPVLRSRPSPSPISHWTIDPGRHFALGPDPHPCCLGGG